MTGSSRNVLRAALMGLLLWTHLALAGTPPLLDAAAYQARLQRAYDALAAAERGRPTPANPAFALQPLQGPMRVRRGDGSIIAVSGLDWEKLSATATGSTAWAGQARSYLRLHLAEVKLWSAATYQPIDAQSVIRNMELQGTIRTGPTGLEQFWWNFYRGFVKQWISFVKWMSRLMPAGPSTTPHFNEPLLRALFVSIVVSLLLLLAYWLWRTLGPHWRRGGARRPVKAAAPAGEDAELLQLAPDELRRRAAAFAEAGNFRQALRHLYLAVLLDLDRAGLWRYDARRTNWEHIRALQASASPLVGPISDLTRRFERVRYGNAECGLEDWRRFEQDSSSLVPGTKGEVK